MLNCFINSTGTFTANTLDRNKLPFDRKAFVKMKFDRYFKN